MRLLKEPLFHFLLLGIAIFAWFLMVSPPSSGPDDSTVIVIDSDDAARMIDRFEATWRRPPTEAELNELIASLVREEVMVREARTLGLDQGDSVIRQRLVQKMVFLTTSAAGAMLPDDTDLQAHLDANTERFSRPAMVAFEQVYFGETADAAELARARDALDAGTDPASVGVRSLLPPEIPLMSRQQVDARFGQGFFDTAFGLPADAWSGPMDSAYGGHLLRVTATQPATQPPLEEIRETVLADWRQARSVELGAAQVEALAGRYEITTPTGSDLKALLN